MHAISTIDKEVMAKSEMMSVAFIMIKVITSPMANKSTNETKHSGYL